MMAAEGRCKALDAAADGYVRSETAVSVLLHPLASYEEAEAGGWVVLLAGTAVNQGGRSSTLTAPNGPSQQAVIRAALEEAELAPASIATLSMHGTGTPLGDPIEVGAAAAVLVEGQNAARAAQPLALAGSKTWVGHSGELACALLVLHLCLLVCLPVSDNAAAIRVPCAAHPTVCPFSSLPACRAGVGHGGLCARRTGAGRRLLPRPPAPACP